ncbi:NAD(P)-dependent alcohol dehydrogenase [Nocardia sp. NPDC004750]
MSTQPVTVAAVTEPRAQFDLIDASLDEPGPHELRVRLEAVGMCHADLAARDGDFPFPLPGVPGHEGVGIVEEVGSAVRSAHTGDRVILTFDSCGRCTSCLSGAPYACNDFVARNFRNGSRPDGSSTLRRGEAPLHGSFFGQSSFATYALANDRNAIPIDADIRPELLAPLGCAIQTGAGAVMNVLRPKVGSSIAVFGAGAVGLAAVMAANLLPVDIIVVDVRDSRLAVARALGATHVVNARRDDPVSAILDITAGGAQTAIESSGNPDAFGAALSSLAPQGIAGIVGSPPFDVSAAVNVARLVNNNIHVVGIVEGASNPGIFLPQLAEMVLRNQLPVGQLITVFPFADIEAAASAMTHGDVIKPVLVF